MNYHFLSKLFPESKLKNKLRKFIYENIFTITRGYKIIALNKKKTIKGKFCKQLFIDYNYDVLTEMIGYQKHYIPKKGDVIVDVGAYIGEFTVYASKLVGDKGKVICIEPDKGNIKLLKKNIKLNNLKNVVLIEAGLWNKDCNLSFKVNAAGSKFDSSDNLIKKVRAVRLDTLFKELNLSKVNMIKMDIEGAEIEALEGCKKIMKLNNIHFAIASYHKINGERTYKKLEKMFKNKGYKVITEYPKHLTTYAKKK
jgi:FkbM family methyltransferase